MLSFSQTIIVEGKYDKARLREIVASSVISIDGFDIYKNEAKRAVIRRLASEAGIIVLMDSDSAGNRLRNHIKSIAGEGAKITNLYIPEVYGKERRKASASKEGKLGVEGMDIEVLKEILVGAANGLPKETEKQNSRTPNGRPYNEITGQKLFELGLAGKADSKKKRQEICKKNGLPINLSAKQFLEIINVLRIEI